MSIPWSTYLADRLGSALSVLRGEEPSSPDLTEKVELVSFQFHLFIPFFLKGGLFYDPILLCLSVTTINNENKINSSGYSLSRFGAQLPVECVDLGLQLVPQRQQLSMPQVNRVLGSHARVPPAVVALPELDVPDRGHREQRHLVVEVGAEHRIEKETPPRVDKGPDGLGPRA